MLELNRAETVETVLANTIKQTKRIVESKRRLGTELSLEGLDGGSGGGLGSRGEGGGGGGKSGGNSEFHFDYLLRECLICDAVRDVVKRALLPST